MEIEGELDLLKEKFDRIIPEKYGLFTVNSTRFHHSKIPRISRNNSWLLQIYSALFSMVFVQNFMLYIKATIIE